MNLDELLARRVSTHHFAKGDIALSDIQSVITQILRTPTAFNLQNWHFSIVASEQGKEALCQAAWGQQPNFVVIAQRVRTDAISCGSCTDGERFVHVFP